MPLQSSGQISLNDLHVEAGGTSGTQCSMNDSDIRGLVNAAANSQMTFSSFYGASSTLWSPIVTVGIYSFKGVSNYGYSDPANVNIGSISSTAVPFKNNGNAKVASLYAIYNSTTWGVFFLIKDCGTDTSNSGWSSLTVNGNTFNRTAGSFSSGTTGNGTSTTTQWSFIGLSYNPFGTTTSGATVTVVFN